LATAFVNVDGQIAVVILNLSDADRMFQLWVENKAAKYVAPAKSIITMVL
jgi:glucosylceramidase